MMIYNLSSFKWLKKLIILLILIINIILISMAYDCSYNHLLVKNYASNKIFFSRYRSNIINIVDILD